jgi:hypothetical protein
MARARGSRSSRGLRLLTVWIFNPLIVAAMMAVLFGLSWVVFH